MLDDFCSPSIPPIAQQQWWQPHGHCVLWEPLIVYTWTICDVMIWACYMAIPIILWRNMRGSKASAILPYLAPFVLACGFGHLWESIAVWRPLYGLFTAGKLCTAVVSLISVIGLAKVLPKICFDSFDFASYLDPRKEAQDFVDSLLPAAVFLWDEKNGDVAVNSNYPKLLGRDMSEVQGRKYLDYVHAEDLPIADVGWNRFVGSGQAKCLLRFRWAHPLREILIEVEGRRRPNGQCYGIVRDVSREARLRRALDGFEC